MLSVKSSFGETFFVSGAEGTALLAVCIAAAVCTLAVIALAIAVAVTLKRRKGETVQEAPDGEEAAGEAPAEPAETSANAPAASFAPVSETHGAPAAVLTGDAVRYNRSFAAKLIQSDDEVKNWYMGLKNELLSYQKVKARRSWKHESYHLGRKSVAQFSFRGKTLCVYLALDPGELKGTKYGVETAEGRAGYAETPCLYRLKNGRRVRYAKDLIAMTMEHVMAERKEGYTPEEADIPYEDAGALLAEGLIKVVGGAPAESPQEAATDISEHADTSESSHEKVSEKAPTEEIAEESPRKAETTEM